MDKQEVIEELERLGFNKHGPYPYVYQERLSDLFFYIPESESVFGLCYNKSSKRFEYYDNIINKWKDIPDQSLSISDMVVLYG